MKQTSILISSLLIACLIGQTYQQAACAFTTSNDEAGAESTFQFSLTGVTAADGYLKLTFGNGWSKDNFPQTGLLCEGSAGFNDVGQQSCEIVPAANNIQVNVYGVKASESTVTAQLHHMRNPYGLANAVTCELWTPATTTPLAPAAAQASTSADAALTPIDDGIINVLQFAQSSQRTGDITNITFSFTTTARFQNGHKLRIAFPNYFQAIPSTDAPASTSFLAGCDLNTACTLETLLASGKITFKSQNLIDQNVAVSRVVDLQNQNLETLILSPSLTNSTQSGQPIEISLPRAIKTPLNTFYPYDLQLIHTDAQGNIISNTDESFNTAYIIATQPGQLNATLQFADTATGPGVAAKYQFFLLTNLPLCKGCIIGVYHQGLTIDAVNIATSSDTDFTPILSVVSQNSSVILLKSDKFLAKLDKGSFTITGITNPQNKINQLKVVIFDRGMNAISATQQPLFLNPVMAATQSCKILSVDQFNSIGSTGKMRIEYKPLDTTNSTGYIALKFSSALWPVSSTMPKVSTSLSAIPSNVNQAGYDPTQPGFFPNTTVTTKFPNASCYEVDINNINSQFYFLFDLQNMINPSTAITSQATILGTCQIYDKAGVLKDTTDLVAGGASIWAAPQLNANFTPSFQLKNGQQYDANFTLSLPKGIPASGQFEITIPNKDEAYKPGASTPSIVGCSPTACNPTVWLQSLASTTAVAYQLTVSSTPVAGTATTKILATIPATTTAANLASGNYKLTIKQLIAPLSQAQSFKQDIKIVLYNADTTSINATTDTAKDKPSIQSQLPASFAASPAPSVTFNTGASQAPGSTSTYLFSFTTTNYIPADGSIVFTLPQTLDTSGTPTVTKTTAADTWTASTADINAAAPYQKKITITFAAITPPATLISFTLGGIKNPQTKINSYNITTQDNPVAPAPINILEQGNFTINPSIDTSQNVCNLMSVDNQYVGIQIGNDIFKPATLAQWTLKYIPRDIAVTQGTIQIALPIAKFQDVSTISCPPVNGEFLPGANSSCTITKNTTYTTVKIVGVIPFYQYNFQIKNITNPSTLISTNTPNIGDNIGYCQLFEASSNKLLDTTFLSMSSQQFNKITITDPTTPKLSFANKVNGALTTLSLNIQAAVGIYSSDKFYLEFPTRLTTDFGTSPESSSNSTFVTSNSVFTLVQYKVNAPSGPLMPQTQTQVASYICTFQQTPDATTGNMKYTITPTFPTGTTFIAPSSTTLFQLNVTNVRLAPQSKSQSLIFKIIDVNGQTKVENTGIAMMSDPGLFQVPSTKGSLPSTNNGAGAATQTYSFSLNTSNPIPINGQITIEFSASSATVDSSAAVVVSNPTTGLAKDSISGTTVTLKTTSYILAGTVITFTIDSITNGNTLSGNKITVTSLNGANKIDTADLYINPMPTTSQCVLQSVSGSQIVGQPANIGFTFYNSAGPAVTGSKITLTLSKKVFGVAPSTVSCSSTNGFSIPAPLCTLAYDTSNKLILTVNNLNVGDKLFEFTVKGMFNPSATQLATFLTDDFGTCALYGSTASAVIGTATALTALPTWTPAVGSSYVTSSNSTNAGVGDLSVTYTTLAPISTGTVFQVAIKQVNDEYATQPYVSSINGLDASTQSTLALAYKTPFSCSIGSTKYTLSTTVSNAPTYQFNGPVTPTPATPPPTDGDYIKITLTLSNTIPSGALCTFVLGNAIKNPLILNQDPNTPPVGTPVTITLFDIKNQALTSAGDTIIVNSQPSPLNVTAQMIGSNLPQSAPVDYQFQIQLNTFIPATGKIVIQTPLDAQQTTLTSPDYDSVIFGTHVFDSTLKTLTFPVTADIPASSSTLLTITLKKYKNSQSLTGNFFNISTIDDGGYIMSKGSVALNPVNPPPSCVIQYTPKDDGSAQTYSAGDQSNFKVKLTLDKALTAAQPGASIIINFSKGFYALPAASQTPITCTSVSPTFTPTDIVCTPTMNQTSSEGQIKVDNLLQDQNVFEFIVKGLINPQAAQQVPIFGQCTAVFNDPNNQQQVIKQVPLANSGVQFQPAVLVTAASASQITNVEKKVGAITDITLTFVSPLAFQNGTSIILSVYRRTADYIGKGITASIDSSIVNCTASACAPKVTITSLVCVLGQDTIVSPYQNIKTTTTFIASQKFDNITLTPSINTPVPSGYSCSINLNGLLYNSAKEGVTNVDFYMNDAKGNTMIKQVLSYEATIAGAGQLSGSAVTLLTATNPPTISQTYTFSFKTLNPIPIGGKIQLQYSANTPNAVPELASATPAGVKYDPEVAITNQGGASNAISLVNSISYIAAGSNVTFSIKGFALSPVYYGNSFTVNTFQKVDTTLYDIDTASIEINSVAPITITSQAYDTTNTLYTVLFKCAVPLNGKDYNISLTYPTSVTFAPTATAPCTYQGGLGALAVNTNCIWTAATKNIIIPNIPANTNTVAVSTDITLKLNKFQPAAAPGTAKATISIVKGPQTICTGDFVPATA